MISGLQFHAMMKIRTAIAYQNTNRWAEAAATLSAQDVHGPLA